MAAGATLRVAASTNGSFTRPSRCYSFAPHLTLGFGSILSLLPKPNSCPRNLSMGNRLTGLWQAPSHPLISHPNHLFLPHQNPSCLLAPSTVPLHIILFIEVLKYHTTRPFCTVTSTQKCLRTSAKFGWRTVTASRTWCSGGKDEGCTFITQHPRLRLGPQGTQRAAGETEELRDGVHVQGAEMTSRSTNKSDLIWVGLPVCTNRAFFCRKCQPQNTHCSR